RLRDLHFEITDGEAQWAGGKLRGKFDARFLPRPSYDFTADLDRVNLAQVPGEIASRLAGTATGRVHLSAAGVGRDELLRSLTGRGAVLLKNVEFRGWDVNASFAAGSARPGVSRWLLGKGGFALQDRAVFLEDLRLDTGHEFTVVNGRVTFARDADLEF